MPIDTTKFVERKIKEYDSELDTRPGSALHDFLIGPISEIIKDYDKSHKEILDYLSFKNPENIPEDKLDTIANSYLTSRNQGTKTKGQVYFYFNQPIFITIPKNIVIVDTQDNQFETISDYTITRQIMRNNTSNYPYYYIGPVNVYSVEPKKISVAAKTSFTLNGSLTHTPSRIENNTIFTPGENKENNIDLYERIKREIYGKSLASPLSIYNLVTSQFSGLRNVNVVTPGDDLMIRDTIIDSVDYNNFKQEDFFYTYHNQHSGALDKKHRAYTGVFVDTDQTSGVQFPEVSKWVKEFSNSQYEGIFDLDANYATQDQYVLIEEFFTSAPGEWQDDLALTLGSEATTNELYSTNAGTGTITTSGTLVTGTNTDFVNELKAGYYIHTNGSKRKISSISSSTSLTLDSAFDSDITEDTNFEYSVVKTTGTGNWMLHDGRNKDNELFKINEFGISGGVLRLGKTVDNSSIEKVIVPISVGELNSVKDSLQQAANNSEIELSFPAIKILKQYTNTQNLNNYSPILHKPLSKHLGIEINCTMNTTDGTENGEISYITVLRNQEFFAPHDGYGIAWKKQPAFLLRMEANNYTDNNLKQTDLDKFAEEYSVSNPENYLGNIKPDKSLWKYNIFLVDNDVLQEEVWVGGEQMWDQSNGINQFIQAAKVWIEDNIDYDFKIKIYEHLGVEAWVWDSNTSIPNDPQIDRGQTWPEYGPRAGTKIDAGNGQYKLNSEGDHFGITVGETKNYEWYLKDLKVTSFQENFPMHLFRFKMNGTGFDLTSNLTVNYHGIGYDKDLSSNNSKVKLGIYNTSISSWEEVGTNTEYTDYVQLDDLKIEGIFNNPIDYLDDQGFLNFAATAANSGTGFENNTDHTLRSYYIEIFNDALTGAHRGNASDIYVDDPENVALGSAVAVVSGSSIDLKSVLNVHGFIQEIIDVKENISQVSFDKSNYTIINNNKGVTYSNSADYTISFDTSQTPGGGSLDGAEVEITYRYWIRGEDVRSFVHSSEYRYPSADYMVKVKPPTTVQINNLIFSGSLTENEARVAIRDYFNNLESNSFEKSDLINLLYDNGATYVSTNMDIEIIEYDTQGYKNVIDMTSDKHTIPGSNLSSYFTTINLLQGMTKQ